MNRSTGEHRHVRMFYQWVVTDSIMQVVESTPPLVQDDNHYYVTSLLAQGYVPRRYKYVDDPENNDPVIDGHIHCKYPLDECGDCIKPGEEMTIEISAYDPDGDSISYEWISLWGYFIVNGETTYVDTTTENFITYLAPYWQYDNLWVSVRDGRGGMASIESEFDVFEQADSCDCGDPNGDGVVNVGDVCYLVTYLYKGGPEPVAPIERADASNDCLVDVADVVYLVAYLYQSGPPPECCWFPPE